MLAGLAAGRILLHGVRHPNIHANGAFLVLTAPKATANATPNATKATPKETKATAKTTAKETRVTREIGTFTLQRAGAAAIAPDVFFAGFRIVRGAA